MPPKTTRSKEKEKDQVKEKDKEKKDPKPSPKQEKPKPSKEKDRESPRKEGGGGATKEKKLSPRKTAVQERKDANKEEFTDINDIHTNSAGEGGGGGRGKNGKGAAPAEDTTPQPTAPNASNAPASASGLNPITPRASGRRRTLTGGDGITTATDATGTNATAATGATTTTTMQSTRITDLVASLELRSTNKFINRWYQLNVTIKLLMILALPLMAIAILLAIGVVDQTQKHKDAKLMVSLTDMCTTVLSLMHSIQEEQAMTLWFLAQPSENMDATVGLHSGAASGRGLSVVYASTDKHLASLQDYVTHNQVFLSSPELAGKVSVIISGLIPLVNNRYAIANNRMDIPTVISFYSGVSLKCGLAFEFFVTMADVKSAQIFRTLLWYTRLKYNVEVEWQSGVTMLVTSYFSFDIMSQWTSAVMQQASIADTVMPIAPKPIRRKIKQLWFGDLVRSMEEIRRDAQAAYGTRPDNLPPANLKFTTWWYTFTTVIGEMFQFQLALVEQIRSMKNDTIDEQQRLLLLFTILSSLSIVLCILVSLLVGWSVRTPLRSMKRMRTTLERNMAQQDELNEIVTRFVPHDFMRLMGVKSMRDLKLGDCVLKKATIFFSDIRSFTSLSERMGPHQNFQFLNRYLHEAGPCIRYHHGFIDKFLGDGIRAIFLDANDAVDGGLALLEAVDKLNTEQTNSAFIFQIGVGLHTGDVLLGTIGEEERMDTTILSDTVNIANNLEALNKQWKSKMLVSHETHILLNTDGLPIRYIGESDLKGKKGQVIIYEIVESTAQVKMEVLDEYNHAVQLLQKGQYQAAIDMFDHVLETLKEDPASKVNREIAVKKLAEVNAAKMPKLAIASTEDLSEPPGALSPKPGQPKKK